MAKTATTNLYQKHYPVDHHGNRFVGNDMGKYIESHPFVPDDMAQRHAYLVGGGIANLLAAAFLLRDARMPGRNITICEALRVNGGSFDGAGDNEQGFITRGGREMGQHFECFWDIMREVPARDLPEPYSVLDEFRQVNEKDPNLSECRIIRNRAQERFHCPQIGLTKHDQLLVIKLLLMSEESTYGKRITDHFGPSFMRSRFYTLWASMFAFQDYQSLTEMKRYFHRFLQYLPGFPDFSCLRFSRYNQYTSFIEPLEKHLRAQGVQFMTGLTVEDVVTIKENNKFWVRGLECVTHDGKRKTIHLAKNDIAIITNGSITESTGYGTMDTPAPYFKDQRGPSFSLWHRLAEKLPNMGRPEVFTSHPLQTTWQSVSFNLYDGYDNPLTRKIRELSKREVFSGKTVTGGIITSEDSPWLCSLTVHRQPQFLDQKEGLCLAWGYGLHWWEHGSVSGKQMLHCTGEEILREFCYHFGVSDSDVDEVIKRSRVRMATMPYITAQFQPRHAGDRPSPVPEGSGNLGFTGQFVETPDDCVFTIEGSARTAQMAVYGLLDLDRDIPPIFPAQYDIRALLHSAKALGDGKLLGEKLLHHLLDKTYYRDILPR